jgi:Peptidase family M28/PDZ domain/PA domain
MRRRVPPWVCLVLLLARPSTGPAQTRPAPTADFDPSVTLPYLASDTLEGRGVGMKGLDTAADYLAEHFRAAGLKPLPGLNGYFQPFDYTAAAKLDADCRLTVAGQTLKIDQDYRPLIFTSEGAFDGLVIFAGYGITSKSHHYDDYAGIDARGKVVLAMRFEPMDSAGHSRFAPPGADWSQDASLQSKVKNAAEHGAAALLLFTPSGLENSDPLSPFLMGYRANNSSIPAFHIKRSAANLMLGEDAAITYDTDGKPTLRSSKVASASGEVRITRTVLHVKNVVGLVPGVGPRADEFVIVGAHYDHLGRGKYGGIFGPPGKIFHGADDNASGTAAVLELAAHAAAGPPRARSIVFILFSAEEEGLIGSAYFTAHPPLDLGKVVVMFNMDMVGRASKQTIYVGGEGTAKDLEAIVQRADVGQPLKIKSLPASVGGRGGLGPSDHMEFALKRIPIVFLFSGMHGDYHRPTDTADKINYAGINEVVALGDRLIDGLAVMPRQPYDSSADIGGMGFASASVTDHVSGAALGVIPDYTTDETNAGVLIQGVRPGSAADTAGLQGGDLIIQFGDKKLAGLQDLADALAAARPGDKVALKVQRGKETLVLHATLTERKG